MRRWISRVEAFVDIIVQSHFDGDDKKDDRDDSPTKEGLAISE